MSQNPVTTILRPDGRARSRCPAPAYGFAFDDIADFASSVQEATAPQSLTLTLTPF